ncbi:S8/S53 family peptidase [Streptomyces sp. MN03-5084-2B]|nr:S8/S53 family peptidase [Streptomyces sp. MN03-5084-2B]
MADSDELFRTTVPGELVADLEHLDLITKELKGLGIEPSVAARDTTLGLALLTGFDPAEEVLSSVLQELRRRFAGRCGGWVPVLGTNRTADLIRPAGPKPMSEGEPGEAERITIPQAAAGAFPVRVGVVDTALYRHQSLPDSHVEADDRLGEPPPGTLRAGHGTFVASVIRAAAPAAHLVVEGVLKEDAGYTASGWAVAVAIASLARRVDILNLSFGCFTADGEPPLVIRRAIERVPAEVLVVAAAGNHGDVTGLVRGRTSRSPSWPAALPRVLAVGSSGLVGQEPRLKDPAGAELSEFTPRLPWVDCTIRGVDIHGAYPSDFHDGEGYTGWKTWSGTSFAAAAVTGALAKRMGERGVSADEAVEQLEGAGVIRKFVLPEKNA